MAEGSRKFDLDNLNEFDTRKISESNDFLNNEEKKLISETSKVTHSPPENRAEVNPFFDQSLPPPSQDFYQFNPPSTYRPLRRPRRRRGRYSILIICLK